METSEAIYSHHPEGKKISQMIQNCITNSRANPEIKRIQKEIRTNSAKYVRLWSRSESLALEISQALSNLQKETNYKQLARKTGKLNQILLEIIVVKKEFEKLSKKKERVA